MTDIVERLRKPSGIGEPMDHMAMEEAADEIERLRALNSELLLGLQDIKERIERNEL